MEKLQRLRVKFSRGERVKFISHLDLMRFWERAICRAKLPLAYSEGFSPHPRIALAAPLPIGVTSSAELMDVFLHRRVSPWFFVSQLNRQLPEGFDIAEVVERPVDSPSLQSQVRYADYQAVVKSEKTPEEIEAAINSLLETEHLLWQHMRDTGPRHYDLRALIENIWLVSYDETELVLGMRLRCSSQGAGRPEQVTLALGLFEHPHSIHRTQLILAERDKFSQRYF
jgi:radical SAM-linked protein